MEIKKCGEALDGLIVRRWGASIIPPKDEEEKPECKNYEDDEEPERVAPEIEDVVDSTGKMLDQQLACDAAINAKAQPQLGEEFAVGRVKQCAVGPDGKLAGTCDENPVLNSIVCEVEFPDGEVRECSANIIAENMLTQIDLDGCSLSLMKGIIDCRKDEMAVPMEDKCICTKSGQCRLRHATSGWQLLVKWNDGSESWIKLCDMKESHPVEVTEFAKARGTDKEPAFAWWVPCALHKRDVILSVLKQRVCKTTHKHGTEVPTSIEHACEIDK